MFKKKNNKKKKGIILNEAVVVESFPGNIYKLKLQNNKNLVTGYLSGNMVRNYIKLIKDDIVVVEFSVFDSNRCRIVYRK